MMMDYYTLMDLDYDSVKALASPTRLKILNMVLDEEATTTKLSKELDKSKSTVSSHLKVLTDSGLLNKDEEEGRRRVVYRPTNKAEAIINGREKKVKFSVVSSALTAVGGVFFLTRGVQSTLGHVGDTVTLEARNQAAEQGSAGAMGTMDTGSDSMTAQSMETANQTAQNTSEGLQAVQNLQEVSPETFIGVALIMVSVSALAYAYLHRKLKKEEK
jgi:DNA-binding transcriptional ArsR family regulator